jgi:hypothetical protein
MQKKKEDVGAPARRVRLLRATCAAYFLRSFTPSLSLVYLDRKSMTGGSEGEISPCRSRCLYAFLDEAGISMEDFEDAECTVEYRNTVRRIRCGSWVQDYNWVDSRQAGGR